jgi:hypothetical protein
VENKTGKYKIWIKMLIVIVQVALPKEHEQGWVLREWWWLLHGQGLAQMNSNYSGGYSGHYHSSSSSNNYGSSRLATMSATTTAAAATTAVATTAAAATMAVVTMEADWVQLLLLQQPWQQLQQDG